MNYFFKTCQIILFKMKYILQSKREESGNGATRNEDEIDNKVNDRTQTETDFYK